MSDEEGELAPEGAPTKWTTPPKAGAPAPDADTRNPDDIARDRSKEVSREVTPSEWPSATVPLNAPPARPRPPPEKPGPAPPATRPATQADLEKSAGFEILKSSALFRASGVVILVGALVLMVQHALVLVTATEFGAPYARALFAGGAGPPEPSGEQIVALLGRIAAATRLDHLGFALFGVGCLLAALGARGLETKQRSTGDSKKVPSYAVASGAVGGACFLGWVALTYQVRTALTGSATGDWPGAVARVFAGFNATPSGPTPGLPPEYTQFVADFSTAGSTWIWATGLLLVGAVALFLFARGLYGATGIGTRLGVLIGFGVIAVIAIFYFVRGFEALFAAVAASAASGSGDVGSLIESVIVPILIGLVGKLFVLPLAGTLLFLLIALGARRIAAAKPGSVFILRRERKEIRKRLAAGETVRVDGGAAPGAASASVETSLPSPPQEGDIIVALSGPQEGPPTGEPQMPERRPKD